MNLQRLILFITVLVNTQLMTCGHSYADNDKRVLPRFATLRSNDINLRRGPGKQYPIDWIYVRSGLPIEIIAEYGVWRQIRDHEGTEGWTHQSMISGRRNVIVTYNNAKLYDKCDHNQAHVTAVIQKDAIGRVLECQIKSCKIQFNNQKGWLRRQDIWGIKSHEEKFK